MIQEQKNVVGILAAVLISFVLFSFLLWLSVDARDGVFICFFGGLPLFALLALVGSEFIDRFAFASFACLFVVAGFFAGGFTQQSSMAAGLLVAWTVVIAVVYGLLVAVARTTRAFMRSRSAHSQPPKSVGDSENPYQSSLDE